MDVRQVMSGARGRYRYRVVAGILVVALPLTLIVSELLIARASNDLLTTSERTNEAVAHAEADGTDQWIAERQRNVAIVAQQAVGRLDAPAVAETMAATLRTYPGFRSIVVTDLRGTVTASTEGASVDVSSLDWFRSVASGQQVVTAPQIVDGAIRWFVAVPVLDASGRPEGVAAGQLDPAELSEVLHAGKRRSSTLSLVDGHKQLVYSTTMGRADDASMIAGGALSGEVDGKAVSGGLDGGVGSVRVTRPDGERMIDSYSRVDSLGWVVVVSTKESVVLAPVADLRSTARQVTAIGAVLAVLFALWFARREAKSLRALADETRSASTEVNASAAQLSASSEELAATTTQQSAAVTEASATTEELARASASIAETVGDVAAQAAETRDNLERAEADIQASSERTLSLADRVNQIGVILTLINEIADQTNLLALNAAIEAARAGEGGKGFAVVAEEVRRLAERSKSSAAEIAVITEGVHAETNATVMAMEKGANQMQRGLALLEEVTQAAEQVRLTTQQQRSATGQVVETMEQLTDASRQVSATAQQIAGASASLAELAGNLEKTAELTTVG